MWLAVRNCAHLSVGWAQKLAHLRWCPDPETWQTRPATAFYVRLTVQALWQPRAQGRCLEQLALLR